MLLKVLSALLSGGLVVLLLAAIIPKVAEFDGIGDAVSEISAVFVLLLFAMAVAIRLALAASYAVVTPGLSLWRSLIAKEASSAVSNVVPGPSGTATQFLILRSWDVSVEQFTGTTLVVSVSSNVLVLVAPGVAFIVWALGGAPSGVGGEHAWAFAVAAIAVAALALWIVAAVAGSERLAAALGRFAQRCVNPLRRVFDKPPMTGLDERCLSLRTQLIGEIRRNGLRAVGFVVAGYVLNGVLLVACMWACGATHAELPMVLGLLLYSLGRLATTVSITPGGIGIVEIVYTSIFIAVLGEPAHDAVVAGVLVYRALTYLLPIMSGALAYVSWRIIRHRDRAASATADAAAAERR